MMRPDRQLTVLIYYLLKNLTNPANRGIPILMYHSISEKIEKGVSPYFLTTTTPQVFRTHIQTLSENGYKGICLQEQEIDNYWNSKQKFVIITFDDGFEDFYTEAFPILKEYNFSATVFLPTAYVGSRGSDVFGGIPHLNWVQIRQLSKEGIEFGSHTINHLVLRNYSQDIIEKEIRDSKKIIEDSISTQIFSFSYPFAFPFDNKKLVNFLEEIVPLYGYKYAVSTKIGISKRRTKFSFMPRIPINNLDDKEFFIAKISGAYNWLNIVQYIYRYISILTSPLKYTNTKIDR